MNENGASMRVKAVLWDLDGTLLDTLDDLTASVNFALAENGLPARTREEVRGFVGNGVRRLIERAASGSDKIPAVYDAFVRHYSAHSRDATRPYDGVIELLDALNALGVRHAIVSNKLEFASLALSRAIFGTRIETVVGDDPARRRKPEPDGVLEAMRRMGVRAEETAYVGDSEVDVLTARGAGVTGVAVSWGYRSEEDLRDAGAEIICRSPRELFFVLCAL